VLVSVSKNTRTELLKDVVLARFAGLDEEVDADEDDGASEGADEDDEEEDADGEEEDADDVEEDVDDEDVSPSLEVFDFVFK
jgi:hypothetical protein